MDRHLLKLANIEICMRSYITPLKTGLLVISAQHHLVCTKGHTTHVQLEVLGFAL